MFRERSKEISGRLHEFDVLGASFPKSAWHERAEKLGAEENGFLSYEKSIQLTRELQFDDPTNPSKDFAKDLRLAVIEQLERRGFLKIGDEDNLKFFSALGMPLDIFHGIDAFVEFADKTGVIHRVTIDETTNLEKIQRGHKAQIIFPPPPDAIADEAAYLCAIDQLADNVVGILAKDLS